MPIVLYRVDERLIHGQVVVGWGGRLSADRMIVVDDEIALSAWEQELYCLGVPPEIEASFVDVEDARRLVEEWRTASRRSIVLFRNIDSLCRFAAGGLLTGDTVNLGGLHHAADRRKVLPYLFLNEQEEGNLAAIAARGVAVIAQDLPSSRAVPLSQLVSN